MNDQPNEAIATATHGTTLWAVIAYHLDANNSLTPFAELYGDKDTRISFLIQVSNDKFIFSADVSAGAATSAAKVLEVKKNSFGIGMAGHAGRARRIRDKFCVWYRNNQGQSKTAAEISNKLVEGCKADIPRHITGQEEAMESPVGFLAIHKLGRTFTIIKVEETEKKDIRWKKEPWEKIKALLNAGEHPYLQHKPSTGQRECLGSGTKEGKFVEEFAKLELRKPMNDVAWNASMKDLGEIAAENDTATGNLFSHVRIE
ncbi:hypothetical protein Ddc_16698 [Ditylenchus destructor]|nr:hypothetical protein Ddc_16698 [Ditylenchus destructor]